MSIRYICASLLCLSFTAMAGGVQANDLILGQCRTDYGDNGLPPNVDAVITGKYVDVVTDPITVPARGEDNPSGEVTILKDFRFDELGINHVVAIEQIYDVDCEQCADLATNPRPWQCTQGITDVLLQAFESKANFNENTRLFPLVFGDAAEPSFISAVLHPADTAFAYRAQSGRLQHASMNFGDNGNSRLKVGTLAARIVLGDAPRTVGPITLRFHLSDEAQTQAPRANEPSTAFLISANFVDPQSTFIPFSSGLETKSVTLSAENLRFLMQNVNEEVKIRFLHLGVVGHQWQTQHQIDVIRKNGDIETINVEDQYNFYGTTLPVSDLVLNKGDEIQFTCRYENTADPIMESLLPEGSPVIPVGPLFRESPCAIQAIYGVAKCDSQFVATFKNGDELNAFDCNETVRDLEPRDRGRGNQS